MNKRFEIRKLTENDVEEVARLMSHVFSEREVIGIRINETPQNNYNNFSRPETVKCSKQDLSFICLDTSLPLGEQVVGFRLCSTLTVGVFENKSDFTVGHALGSFFNDCKIRYLKAHKETIHSDHLYFVSLGVKNGYENKGIASKLTKVALNNAKIKGLKFVMANASAAATQRIFEHKLKMKTVYSIAYDDIEYNGVKFLNGITDPKNFVVYELNLSEWNIEDNEVQLHFD
ncbi:hypothetical protein B4U80_12088 [Leptotrombidium deliense]|uniref:N-acetyltransferase domain-containing protein n=1 Tax=Leptotrombidium deliense TaxID=299467 RepID=A0A443RYY0_9ACAR|nr:hypothetical protein B4U80_12088 [Leptotrombidium deliense]